MDRLSIKLHFFLHLNKDKDIGIKDGKIQEISGVPEIYYMGQGGLMDIELHPKFNINNKIFLSFAESSNRSEGGNTAIMSAILDQNKLINKKILSKINEIKEFNIGHFIIGESILLGLKNVIKKFKTISKK